MVKIKKYYHWRWSLARVGQANLLMVEMVRIRNATIGDGH